MSLFDQSLWQVAPADPARAASLAAQLGLDPLIGQLLINRRMGEPWEAAGFLRPELDALSDPMALPDLERALVRIRRAVSAHESIAVFGDSDVDGVTASVIMYETLTSLGVPARQVAVHISNRTADGYGFPQPLIARLKRRGVTLLILVDCGTNQAEEIRLLAQQGIDTIVVDHHVPLAPAAEPPQGTLPQPVALVNPHRGRGPGWGLCSAGVAVKLAQALYEGDLDRTARLLDLAALGTLADCAPLIGDNRIFVAEGLPRLLRTARPGLRLLCESMGVTQPTPGQVLSRLVPRLNACGRLGDARPVWGLLAESGSRHERLMAAVDQAHQTTKALSRQIAIEAFGDMSRLSFKDELVIVIGRKGWHPGLMGPLASQLMERYGRPAITVALGEQTGVGSGRSTSAFNLFEALRACEGSLLRYGGHPQACGLTIQAQGLEPFRQAINRHAVSTLGRQQLIRTLSIDAEAGLAQLTPAVGQAVERFRPFGSGNSRPTVLVRGVSYQQDGLRPAGASWLTDGGGRRVRIRGRVAGLRTDERYDVVVSPVWLGQDVAVSVGDARLA